MCSLSSSRTSSMLKHNICEDLNINYFIVVVFKKYKTNQTKKLDIYLIVNLQIDTLCCEPVTRLSRNLVNW